MSEYWTEKDVMENAILDLQHERDDLKAELASRDKKISELEAIVSPVSFRKFLVEQIKDPELAEAYVKACIQDATYKELLASRDETIRRLKEVGGRMYIAHDEKDIRECEDWCALMKELE